MRKRTRDPAVLALTLALALLTVWACAGPSAARVEPQAGEAAHANERRPLQIGKLIKRRQIAPVLSVAHAGWLTRPERDAEEQPDRVVESLNIANGATIVDLGAGVGYFTWRLAKRVGSAGRVIAVDIQPGMLERLHANLAERGVDNVQVVLSEPDNPLLPSGEVDLVLLVDVYHELAFPEAMMEHVRRSLKPDGRVVIIEYRKEDPDVPISALHKMTAEEVRSELEPMGFRLVERMDFLPTQHIQVFQAAKQR